MEHLVDYARKYGYDNTPYFQRNCERVLNVQRGIMDGFYEHASEGYVLEKNRIWANQCSLLSVILGESPRFVATTRRISEVIASFFLVAERSGPNNRIDAEVRNTGIPVNPWVKSRIIWERYVCRDWKDFKSGYESHPECFLLTDYSEINNNPEDTVAKIYEHFGMESCGVRKTNLVNPSPEDDSVYGIPGLHDVRPTLKRTSPPPEEVLGEEVCAYWDEKGLEFWNK